MKKRSSHLFLYLVLNIILSAGVTLGVLYYWDQTHPRIPQAIVDSVAHEAQVVSTAQATPPAAPALTSTPLPAGQKVIEIMSVIGAGDLSQEVVMLKRDGDGDLRMAGWKLTDGHGDEYVFPSDPELVLYKNGGVQIFSRTGTDSAAEMYWNRTKPAFQSGDTVSILDPQGVKQAVYVVP